MGRLEDRVTVTDVCRRCEAHAPDDACREIRQDVPEHVLGDHHIEALGLLHEVKRGRVDVNALGLDVGVLLRDTVKHLPEECHCGQYIGFVYKRDATLSPGGRLKGGAHDPLRLRPRDAHRVFDRVGVRSMPRFPLGEQALRVLAVEDDIDVARSLAPERRQSLLVEIDRANPLVEVEILSNVDLRGHFRAVRPTHVREAHRAE